MHRFREKCITDVWTDRQTRIHDLSAIQYHISFYNLGHNILELYNVLIQIRLTTSKTKCNIYYSKLGIQLDSQATERLKAEDLRK